MWKRREGQESMESAPGKAVSRGGQSSQPEVYKGHGNIVEELTNLLGLDEGPVQRCRWC